MLTREDCIALCDLSEDEVKELAEAMHIPDVVAAEFGSYVIHMPDGTKRLKRIILDDLATARARGDEERAIRLRILLHYFGRHHPDPVPPAATGCCCNQKAAS